MVPNLRFSNLDKLMKVRLGDICTITGGYAFDSHKMTQKGDYQIIKMGNLYNGIFDLSRNSSFINAPTKKELEYLIQENDILITLTGTTNKKGLWIYCSNGAAEEFVIESTLCFN